MGKPCLIPFLFLCLTGCQTNTSKEPSEHEEAEAIQISLWNKEIELFIEHPPFVAGEPTRFVTHVTHLQGWRPRTEGPIQLILSRNGEKPIEIQDPSPARDGIYIPTLTFPNPGTWEIEVRVPLGETTSVQKIAGVTVFSSAQAIRPGSESEDEGISFLKEQQWRIPFYSEEVLVEPFRESLTANGMVAPRAGGEVVIHAPVSGRLLASKSGLPHIGNQIKKGQLLGSLLPRLDQINDPASLDLAVRKAELTYDFAQKEFKRVEDLFKKEAVPENRLRLAELEVKSAQADLVAAQKRLRQYSAVHGETGLAEEKADLFSPISGTIIEARVVPGALVSEGDLLFQIIDLSNVWLNIQIPEGDIGKIAQAQGAWFKVAGMDRLFEVDAQSGGRLVALGGKIDPGRRTVPLIFELPNPDQLLKIGMFARVSVMTGQTAMGPSIPVSALLEEAGQSVAYVQTGGESFERRILQLGIRDGERIQVRSGLAAGERVVTTGAYQIRLAATSTAVPAHGHEH